jgi:hypothetical protein
LFSACDLSQVLVAAEVPTDGTSHKCVLRYRNPSTGLYQRCLFQTPKFKYGWVQSTIKTNEKGAKYVDASMAFKLNGEEEEGSEMNMFVCGFLGPLQTAIGEALATRWGFHPDCDPAAACKNLRTGGGGVYAGSMWAKINMDAMGKPKDCAIYDGAKVPKTFQDLMKAVNENKAEVRAIIEFTHVFVKSEKNPVGSTCLVWGVNAVIQQLQYFEKDVMKGFSFVDAPVMLDQ